MEPDREKVKPDLESTRQKLRREVFDGLPEAEKLSLLTETAGLGVAMTTWCDQRTDLDQYGLNAYGLPAVAAYDRVFSSATSNPMDVEDVRDIDDYLEELHRQLTQKKDYGEAVELLTSEFDKLREGLVGAINTRSKIERRPLLIPVECEVITSANGTEVEYLPLLVAKHLAGPEGKIRNVFFKEMGSATPLACEGKISNTKNWRGEMAEKGKSMRGMENILPVEIEIRANGLVRSASEIESDLDDQFRIAGDSNEVLVVHIVPATKTGERAGDGDMVARLCAKYPEVRVVKVADCAQGRTSEEELAQLIKDGFFLNLTASKFFEAPSFCAATFLNKENSDLLGEAIRDLTGAGRFPEELSFYYCLADFPTKMREGLAGHLPELPNLPLLARWQIGQRNMNHYFSIAKNLRERVMRSLGSLVTQRLAADLVDSRKDRAAAQTPQELSEVSFMIPGIETEAQAKSFRTQLAHRGYWIPQVSGRIFRFAIGVKDIVRINSIIANEGGDPILASTEYFAGKYAPLLNAIREFRR